MHLMRLGCVAFLLLGFAIAGARHGQLLDFRMAHGSAKCLLQNCDPYNQSDLAHMYFAENGEKPTDKTAAGILDDETRYIYLPTVFAFTLPFAILPVSVAQGIWIATIAGSFILASFLMWNLAASHSPLLSGALLCFCLANSGSLISSANPGGIAISLCIVAAWCFLKERFVTAGIVCLAISLMLKPHDTGLVWLYFVLAGGMFRKRALQSLSVFGVLSLPTVLWVFHISPNWIKEIQSNMLALSAHGSVSDPSPAFVLGRGTFMITDLQAVISFFWDDPKFYNSVSYFVCILLLAVWIFVTLRSRPLQNSPWFALAAVSALSMLPFYHRQYDARLVILTIPACALLWAEGGLAGRLALLVNSVGFFLIADLPWAFALSFIHSHLPSAAGLSRQIVSAAVAFPVPLILLTMCVFYLRVYAKRAFHPIAHEESSTSTTDQTEQLPI